MLAAEILLSCFAACCLALSGTYTEETQKRLSPEQKAALFQLQEMAEKKAEESKMKLQRKKNTETATA